MVINIHFLNPKELLRIIKSILINYIPYVLIEIINTYLFVNDITPLYQQLLKTYTIMCHVYTSKRINDTYFNVLKFKTNNLSDHLKKYYFVSYNNGIQNKFVVLKQLSQYYTCDDFIENITIIKSYSNITSDHITYIMNDRIQNKYIKFDNTVYIKETKNNETTYVYKNKYTVISKVVNEHKLLILTRLFSYINNHIHKKK